MNRASAFREAQGLRIERVGVDAHDLTPRAVADRFVVGLKGSVLAGAQFALYPLEVRAHVTTEAHASDDDLSSFSLHDGQSIIVMNRNRRSPIAMPRQSNESVACFTVT